MKLFMYLCTLSLQFSRFISFQNKVASSNINRLFHKSSILYARPKKLDKYIDNYDDNTFDKTVDNKNNDNIYNKYSGKSLSALYKPRTENQVSYVKYLTDVSTPIVVGVGPAGSGKTLFACVQAVSALNSGFIQKIILTRPVVPVEEDMGFLPGNLNQKMDPWTRPIFDILLESYAQKDIDAMLHNGVLEISPLAYMRGRTFKNAFIIADEMQNSSPNQMLMLTTRIGDKSKLVITGDLVQSDRGSMNGLVDFIAKVRAYEIRNAIDRKLLGKKKEEVGIRIIEMRLEDIQRSPIVSKLLKIYADPPIERDSHVLSSTLLVGENDSDVMERSYVNTTTIHNSISSAVNISISNIPGVTLNTVEKYKMMNDRDAALIPLRSNTTNSKYYPWEPMNI